MPDEPLTNFEDQQRRIARAEALYAEQVVASGGFDPGEYTVAEVEEYIAAHPDEADTVLAAEAAGKNRTTLTGG